jgi:hypothetical protein
MIMVWPVQKWLALATMIDEFLAHNPCILSPFECSSLLGLIRNTAPVAPLGGFLLTTDSTCPEQRSPSSLEIESITVLPIVEMLVS